jgi:hypothetical protein
MPQVLSDGIPILSSALGFRRNIALVTVSVVERVRGNRLNIQPCLITSTRELRRLSDEQIITIGRLRSRRGGLGVQRRPVLGDCASPQPAFRLVQGGQPRFSSPDDPATLSRIIHGSCLPHPLFDRS